MPRDSTFTYGHLRRTPPLDPHRLGPGVDIEDLKRLPPPPYRCPFNLEPTPESTAEQGSPRPPSPFLWGIPQQHVGNFEYNWQEMEEREREMEALKAAKMEEERDQERRRAEYAMLAPWDLSHEDLESSPRVHATSASAKTGLTHSTSKSRSTRRKLSSSPYPLSGKGSPVVIAGGSPPRFKSSASPYGLQGRLKKAQVEMLENPALEKSHMLHRRDPYDHHVTDHTDASVGSPGIYVDPQLL
ncbi:hypothetical protein PM082_014266 [Marasmius tenuissimus]|nr:hypothetical protein PM082_014266 [Marasmius tenuissimus]